MTFLFFFYPLTFILNAGIHTTNKPKDKIELRENCITRSAFALSVEAYKNGTTIDLFVENYTGQVEIFILQSPIYHIVEINEAGYVSIDISQLSVGRIYILRIVIDNKEFEGTFER
ncbi:hypothetical protein [uncultured Proteiniphilum sp.]|uniref:hypothetical protein n=1 Tax=uncultured Proteiniphilum sp. TaxID=497637 RepID=UPI0026190E2D|nr:hypothetical protein [uncultured Proteiniphilum sp.]